MGIVVAIDGPAGAGKSTVADAVARRCGLTLVDTGAIYRTLALQARLTATAEDDAEALAQLARGNRENQDTVARMGGIRPLVLLLEVCIHNTTFPPIWGWGGAITADSPGSGEGT